LRINFKDILIIVLLLFSHTFFGQKEGKSTPHVLKIDFKLPTAIANKSFKGVMSGLADIDAVYQIQFKTGLFINTGLKYSFWKLESTVFSGDVVTGKLEVYQPFVGLGYRHPFSDKVFLETELKSGFSFINTKSNSLTTTYQQQAFAIEPKFGLYYRSSEFTAVGLTINYNIITTNFTPDNIGQPNFPGMTPEASVGIYQYLSVGFGIYGTIPSFK
jgi:hypothetical protein